MTTRRDREVTSDAARMFFQQIRGLFRHVPFNERDFAHLAPNVAQTLSPANPYEALPVFWDVLDAQERDKYMDALITLLGYGAKGDNVLHRKSALDNNVHPRTIARRADDAIKVIVRHIEDNYAVRFARVEVWHFERDADLAYYLFDFKCRGDMELPEITVGNADPTPLQLVPDADRPGIHVAGGDILVSARSLLSVEWQGTVIPSYSVNSHSARRLNTLVTGNECWLTWYPDSDAYPREA